MLRTYNISVAQNCVVESRDSLPGPFPSSRLISRPVGLVGLSMSA
jgi:hypothetical protein